MNIGTEQPAIVIEPIEDPVPREMPFPDELPVETPEREPVLV